MGVTGKKRAQVLNREALAELPPQTRPKFEALADAWEAAGDFDVEIPVDYFAPPVVRRDAAQVAAINAAGLSGASTLKDTPHGRGGAVDFWVEGFRDYAQRAWSDVPPFIKAKFLAFGEFAEAHGFTWGGRWRTAKLPNGDHPHVEVANWRALPFPPASPLVS